MRIYVCTYVCQCRLLYVWNFEFSDFVLLASHEPTLGRQPSNPSARAAARAGDAALKRQVRIVNVNILCDRYAKCIGVCVCDLPSLFCALHSTLPVTLFAALFCMPALGSNYSSRPRPRPPRHLMTA